MKAAEREQSNTSVIVENKYVVKIFRRIAAGIHPEIEIGRFLADVAHFKNAPTLLGSLELVEGESRSALAVVHDFVENQGDAWTVTGAALDRLIDEQRLLPDEAVARNVGSGVDAAAHAADRPAHRPSCIGAREPPRHCRLRARADHARRLRALDRRVCSRSATRVLDLLAAQPQ